MSDAEPEDERGDRPERRRAPGGQGGQPDRRGRDGGGRRGADSSGRRDGAPRPERRPFDGGPRGDGPRRPRPQDGGARGDGPRRDRPQDGERPRYRRDGPVGSGSGGGRDRRGAEERPRRTDRRDAAPGAPGRRSTERGGRTPGSDRPYRERRDGARDDRGAHVAGPRVPEPPLPDDVRAADLDRAARAELRTLSKDNADAVARHLVMAGRLIEEDPAEAHRHALAAARRAGRVAVVRESVAITAYAVGEFGLALRELRTFRRISGSDDQIGLMVDSERGVGRPDRALELGRSVDRSALPLEAQAALAIAMSGARLDLQDPAAALDELERMPVDLERVHAWTPALYDALAAVHGDLGHEDEAERWRRRGERALQVLDAVGAEESVVDVVTEATGPEQPESEDGTDAASSGVFGREPDVDGSDVDGRAVGGPEVGGPEDGAPEPGSGDPSDAPEPRDDAEGADRGPEATS